MTLKRTKIRGVESYSMACSEKELGISDEHEGIIFLDHDAPVGERIRLDPQKPQKKLVELVDATPLGNEVASGTEIIQRLGEEPRRWFWTRDGKCGRASQPLFADQLHARDLPQAVDRFDRQLGGVLVATLVNMAPVAD